MDFAEPLRPPKRFCCGADDARPKRLPAGFAAAGTAALCARPNNPVPLDGALECVDALLLRDRAERVLLL